MPDSDKTQNVAISRYCFLESLLQTKARKFVLPVQHDYFSYLTNDILALWSCRCRSRRLRMNSLFLAFYRPITFQFINYVTDYQNYMAY